MKSLKYTLNLLSACAIFTAVLLVATSYWGSTQANAVVQQTFVSKDLTADILPPPLYLIELRLVVSQAIEGSITSQEAKGEIDRLIKEYNDRVTYWRANPPFGMEKQLLGVQHQAAEEFIKLATVSLNALAAGDTEAARAHLVKAHAQYLKHRDGVNATVKESLEFANAAAATYEETLRHTAYAQWFMLVLSSLLLAALGVWARKNIWAATGGEPVSAAAVATEVAQGNLAVAVPVETGDQLSMMAQIEAMRAALSLVVSQVHEASQGVAIASVEIAQGNQDLSSRTEAQASALEETSAAMRQLREAISQNVDSSLQANRLAIEASDVAAKGGALVGQFVNTMQDINTSSRQISDIIGVIDGIAFQTNILALNAAVEAARAGEQGRGFAVVAKEVRSLAGRSADAAKEIKILINDSVTRVSEGARLVDQTSATMTEVVTSIKRVTNLMGEISNASSEQREGVSRVADAIIHMDQSTQQNAALVEEMAAAANSLKSQSQDLVEVISVFKLRRTTPTLAGQQLMLA